MDIPTQSGCLSNLPKASTSSLSFFDGYSFIATWLIIMALFLLGTIILVIIFIFVYFYCCSHKNNTNIEEPATKTIPWKREDKLRYENQVMRTKLKVERAERGSVRLLEKRVQQPTFPESARAKNIYVNANCQEFPSVLSGSTPGAGSEDKVVLNNKKRVSFEDDDNDEERIMEMVEFDGVNKGRIMYW